MISIIGGSRLGEVCMDFLITFVEGIASFISPCVLPVIPVYISYFASDSKSTKKAIMNSFGFVFGFSIIFILLGVFAGSFGKLVHSYSNYINIILGLLLIVMGLNYMEVIFIKILNKTNGIKRRNTDLTLFTSILFGILFSLTWTPCIGAFLSSALVMASTSGSILKGALLLLIYSIGLGLPFIITTLFMEKIKVTFDFIKKHYNIINKFAGSILVLYGIFNVMNGVIEIFK